MSLAQLHPIAVHFPIVFFLSLAVFDLAVYARGGTIGGRSAVANVSAGLAVLAGLFALAAFVLGGLAYDTAVAGGVAESSLEMHESLGTVTALSFAAWAVVRAFLWWRAVPAAGGMRAGIVAVEAAGAVLVVVTAYFGGQLVYELGVNVAHAAGV